MFVKDRKQTKKALMTGVLCTIVYLPWVSIAFSSFAKISKGFWIAPITIKTVFYWLIYPFVLTSWQVQTDDIMYIGVYIIAFVKVGLTEKFYSHSQV
jgi:hypothetical protein